MPKLDQPLLFTPAPLPTAELSADERLACLRLIRSENVGPVTFRELINRFGGAAHALQALPDLSRRGGSGRAIRLCPKADAERELETAERAGAVPVFTIEPDYPVLLARIEAPPPTVYVKGRRELLNRPAIAIVGSRQCSAAGVQVTRQFASELAEAGFVIVSGLARGIDRAAHEAALTRGTVAVLAGGIDWIYPPEHADLQRRIGSEGCLVTERPPGFQPREKDFPWRNRIIAGLVHGVVIIEAAMRSGTLIGLDEPRADYGLPVDTASNQTSRHLPSGNIAPGDLMNAVLTALGPAPVAIDAIARSTGLSVQDVQIAILELDLAGRIERQGHSLVALKGG